MVKRFLAAALASVLLLGILAGCNDGGSGRESFPGEFDVPYSLGDKFTINCIGEGDDVKRYKWVVCDVTLEVSVPDKKNSIITIFEERNHRLREIVNNSIAEKSLDNLHTTAEREALSQEILEKINEEFNTDAVHRVVFGELYFA